MRGRRTTNGKSMKSFESPGKINLKGLTLPELEELVAEWGEPKYRAEQLASWIYGKRESNFEHMTNLPKAFRAKLMKEASISEVRATRCTVSDAEVATKYLFELANGNRVESVLMHDQERTTICISSQVGCAMACDFCATGKMGFFRNLSASEILDQFTAIERDLSEDKAVTNIVFMGMGEPLANYDQTLKSVRLLSNPDGYGMSEKRITISTVGLAPRMRLLAREGLKCNLALSLNATTDGVRTRLMPINEKYPIDEVLDAAKEWALATKRKTTLEYVLIRDVNDTDADAKRLRKLMSRLPCKLNLIPFNEIEDSEFRRPKLNRIERFRQLVASARHVAPIRFSKGHDIAAACGQLRTDFGKPGTMLRNAS